MSRVIQSSLCLLTLSLSCCQQGRAKMRLYTTATSAGTKRKSMQRTGCANLRRPRSIVAISVRGFICSCGERHARPPNVFGPRCPFVLGSLIARDSCTPTVSAHCICVGCQVWEVLDRESRHMKVGVAFLMLEHIRKSQLGSLNMTDHLHVSHKHHVGQASCFF